MPKTQTPKPEAQVPTTRSFTEVMESVSPKDRANLQKHLDALTPRPAHADLWKAIVATLSSHAPHACQTVGMESIRFFVQDGTYKLQLFALEDKPDEPMRVYVPNVLEAALRTKLIKRTAGKTTFGLGSDADKHVEIEELDGSNTMDPPVHYKFMIGLNRKALRITLPPSERSMAAVVDFVRGMCALAVGANDAEAARNKAAMQR